MVKNGFGHPHHLTPKAPLFLREGGRLKWGAGNFRKLWGISLILFLLLLKIKIKNKKNKRK